MLEREHSTGPQCRSALSIAASRTVADVAQAFQVEAFGTLMPLTLHRFHQHRHDVVVVCSHLAYRFQIIVGHTHEALYQWPNPTCTFALLVARASPWRP